MWGARSRAVWLGIPSCCVLCRCPLREPRLTHYRDGRTDARFTAGRPVHVIVPIGGPRRACRRAPHPFEPCARTGREPARAPCRDPLDPEIRPAPPPSAPAPTDDTRLRPLPR